MKRKWKFLFIVFCFFALLLTTHYSLLTTRDVSAETANPAGEVIVKLSAPIKSTDTDFPGFIGNLYKFAYGISGIVAVGMIVAGAIYYGISGDSPQKAQEGKDMIWNALWGIGLLAGSYLILSTINPELVKLDTIKSDLLKSPSITTRSGGFEAIVRCKNIKFDSGEDLVEENAKDEVKSCEENYGKISTKKSFSFNVPDCGNVFDCEENWRWKNIDFTPTTKGGALSIFRYSYYPKSQTPVSGSRCVAYAYRIESCEEKKDKFDCGFATVDARCSQNAINSCKEKMDYYVKLLNDPNSTTLDLATAKKNARDTCDALRQYDECGGKTEKTDLTGLRKC